MGAGFIAADIKDVVLTGKIITIYFKYGHYQAFTTNDFNLRETEELIEYIKNERQKEMKP